MMKKPMTVTLLGAKPSFWSSLQGRLHKPTPSSRSIKTSGAAVARPSVRLVRTRHMLWLAVLLAGYVTSQVWGTPHMLITYQYWGSMEDPSFHQCTYWGLHSRMVQGNGRCPFFRLLSSSGND